MSICFLNASFPSFGFVTWKYLSLVFAIWQKVISLQKQKDITVDSNHCTSICSNNNTSTLTHLPLQLMKGGVCICEGKFKA